MGHWRASAFLICAAEITATLAAAPSRSEPSRLILSTVLISLGAASLLPWEWYWQLIFNVLCVAAIAAEAFVISPGNPAAVELGPMIERLMAEFQVVAERKGLALEYILDGPGAVRFDEYCLTQAVSNLLQNAINFTDSGSVNARLYRDPSGGLALAVGDTGEGISEQYLPRLFEPFSRESGTRRGSHGAGVGLTLTRQYLEMNGSWLSVSSAKGRGSVFTIHFPRDLQSNGEQDAA